MSTNADDGHHPHSSALSIKETLVSITIAFMMALVFRGFVVEGFQIPTGSMAPTLLGAHMDFRGETTGYEWMVGPWYYADRGQQIPRARQGGGEYGPVTVNDPMNPLSVTAGSEVPVRAGDRVFVLKYIKGLFDPSRWDVAVFSYPGTRENYIKRVVGVPGEELAIVDGDIFTRPADPETQAEHDARQARLLADPQAAEAAWSDPAWKIRRKSERVQREMFQPVYDSVYAPPPGATGSLSYRSPWAAEESGWSGVADEPVYTFDRASAATLKWNLSRIITDWTSYNQTGPQDTYAPPVPGHMLPPGGPVPTGDIAVSLAVEPEAEGLTTAFLLSARGRDFEARIGTDGTAQIRVRTSADDNDGRPGPWSTLASGTTHHPLKPGVPTDVEFWHVDQAAWLFVEGKLVAGGPEDGAYTLTPAERVRAAIGRTFTTLAEDRPGSGLSLLADSRLYRESSLELSFEGSAFKLLRVRVWRDVSYRTTFETSRAIAARGGHPANTPVLGPDDYFMCGDNSQSSEDSRLWTREHHLDPWVNDQLGGGEYNIGTVHRRLVLGKAFIVYFPAPKWRGKLPVPDAGKVRWIW